MTDATNVKDPEVKDVPAAYSIKDDTANKNYVRKEVDPKNYPKYALHATFQFQAKNNKEAKKMRDDFVKDHNPDDKKYTMSAEIHTVDHEGLGTRSVLSEQQLAVEPEDDHKDSKK